MPLYAPTAAPASAMLPATLSAYPSAPSPLAARRSSARPSFSASASTICWPLMLETSPSSTPDVSMLSARARMDSVPSSCSSVGRPSNTRRKLTRFSRAASSS